MEHFFKAGKIDQGRQEKICFSAWDLVFCQTQQYGPCKVKITEF